MHLRVWQDNGGVLFRELQDAAHQHMAFIARLCDQRFRELLQEPAGPALRECHRVGQEDGKGLLCG